MDRGGNRYNNNSHRNEDKKSQSRRQHFTAAAAAGAAPSNSPEDDNLDIPGVSNAPLKHVQIDGLAVLKILKHCRESFPELVTGQLLGLDVEDCMEVTNCFPFPTRGGDDDDKEGAEYQIEMMRNLRDVNVDNNTVGWYQSTFMGSFINQEMIETQFTYQENIHKSIMIVYDPHRSGQGVLSLKAFRMSPSFFKLFKAQDFTPASIKKMGLKYDQIFEEIPIKVHNSALSQAMLYELDDPQYLPDMHDRLDLTIDPYLEKELEFMLECADELSTEQGKYMFALRKDAQYQSMLQKRRADNEQRKQQGREELPEDDIKDMIRPVPVPPLLETLVYTNQMNNICGQINELSNQASNKLHFCKSLQKRKE
eukprot:CFRG5160T1